MAVSGSGVVGFYRQRRLLVWVVAVAVVAFGVVVLVGSRDRGRVTEAGPAGEGGPSEAASEPAVVRRDAGDVAALGAVDAPVVIVEWLDLRCPFCARFSRETLPGIVERYVDAGLVRYEVRDVAYFGDRSVDGAVAARAAGEQGRFHEYLAAAYAAAPDRGHPDLPREQLVAFAREAGVADLYRFEADLDRDDLRRAVQERTSAAGRLGVTSVPFFVIGDVAFAGAQPTEVFEQVIEEQLAEARAG